MSTATGLRRFWIALIVLGLAGQAGAAEAAEGGAGRSVIASPHSGAVLRHASVRVVIRARTGASKPQVELRGHDVSSHFRARGGRLVGTLGQGQGVRRGVNELRVVRRRGGRRGGRLQDTAAFYLVRRDEGFVRVRLRHSDPRSAQIDILSKGSPAEVRRRPRTVRAWLNGRPVTRALIAPHGARRTVTLSATHGLRFGANRLRVEVLEQEAGRYAVVRRRFVVGRDGPLAAAGWDRGTTPGVGVRIGGRAKPARGGRLRYRWRIVRRPKGSKAQLKGVTRARPRLVPDRTGGYVLRQVVSERHGGARSAALSGSSSADDLTLTATPSTGALRLATDGIADAARGTVIGDPVAQQYSFPHPGKGATIQALMVNRGTFETDGFGNTWCCEDQGGTSIQSLSDSINGKGLDDLVVLTIPPNRITATDAGETTAFNKLLGQIGVNPLSQADFTASDEQITIVGVPGTGLGTGWIRRRKITTGVRGLETQGYLAVDGKKTAQQYLRFRFEPDRLPFDTDTKAGGMNIGGTHVPYAGFSPGGNGGPFFHVVEVDPGTLQIINIGSFGTDTNNDNEPSSASLTGMAAFIDTARQHDNYVAIQSVGQVFPTQINKEGWSAATEALVKMGANPHLFNIGGTYAFFGRASQGRGQVIQSNSQTVLNPTVTPATKDTGTLEGRLHQDADGNWVPTRGSAGLDNPDGSLYDVILRPSTAWPFTAEAGEPDAAAYSKALAYITSQDSTLKGYGSDIRKSYLQGFDTEDYTESINQLTGLQYPGTGSKQVCPKLDPSGAYPFPSAPNGTPPLGYSYEQFCNLRQELLTEFNWIHSSIEWFGDLEKALQYSGDAGGKTAKTIGDDITAEIDPPDGELVSSVLFLVESMSEVGEVFEAVGEGASAGAGLIASIYDLGSSIASDTKTGQPIGQKIDDEASNLGTDTLADVAGSAEAVDAVRAAAISDYGRLKALAALMNATSVPGPNHPSGLTVADLQERFSAGLGRYYMSELSPLIYKPGSLRFDIDTSSGPVPAKCNVDEGYSFSGATDGSWVPFKRHAFADPGVTDLPYQWETRLFMYSGAVKYYWPPVDLTSAMFNSPFQGTKGSNVSDNGWGIKPTTWMWEQGDTFDSGDDYNSTCSG